MSTAEMMARRTRLLGPNVSTFYDEPVALVRGEGVWVWDSDGRRYLDCYNNVPHVGHCHPHVVEAITRQASTLNTHTRYPHRGILDYVERLTATFVVPYSPGNLTAVGHVRATGRTDVRTLLTTGMPAALRLAADRTAAGWRWLGL